MKRMAYICVECGEIHRRSRSRCIHFHMGPLRAVLLRNYCGCWAPFGKKDKTHLTCSRCGQKATAREVRTPSSIVLKSD